MFDILSAPNDLLGLEQCSSGEVVDSSLGLIYQAEVPLIPKPEKHEQCEVTENESKIQARPVPRLY